MEEGALASYQQQCPFERVFVGGYPTLIYVHPLAFPCQRPHGHCPSPLQFKNRLPPSSHTCRTCACNMYSPLCTCVGLNNIHIKIKTSILFFFFFLPISLVIYMQEFYLFCNLYIIFIVVSTFFRSDGFAVRYTYLTVS